VRLKSDPLSNLFDPDSTLPEPIVVSLLIENIDNLSNERDKPSEEA
jgi:hypothetical protein